MICALSFCPMSIVKICSLPLVKTLVHSPPSSTLLLVALLLPMEAHHPNPPLYPPLPTIPQRHHHITPRHHPTTPRHQTHTTTVLQPSPYPTPPHPQYSPPS